MAASSSATLSAARAEAHRRRALSTAHLGSDGSEDEYDDDAHPDPARSRWRRSQTSLSDDDDPDAIPTTTTRTTTTVREPVPLLTAEQSGGGEQSADAETEEAVDDEMDSGFGVQPKQAPLSRATPPAPPLKPPFSVVSAAARTNPARPASAPASPSAATTGSGVTTGTATSSSTVRGPDVHNNPDVAQTVFDAAWRRVEREIGAGNMRFPKEIIFLNGAPGSGKGTMAEYFVRERHITHVATSDLLDTPEARRIKAEGRLVNDSEVFNLVLKMLLSPQHHYGVVLDGFPRTRVQVECVRQLHQKMLELHKTHRHSDLSQHFPRPKFHMVMLYIEEEVKKTGAWQ